MGELGGIHALVPQCLPFKMSKGSNSTLKSFRGHCSATPRHTTLDDTTLALSARWEEHVLTPGKLSGDEKSTLVYWNKILASQSPTARCLCFNRPYFNKNFQSFYLGFHSTVLHLFSFEDGYELSTHHNQLEQSLTKTPICLVYSISASKKQYTVLCIEV